MEEVSNIIINPPHERDAANLSFSKLVVGLSTNDIISIQKNTIKLYKVNKVYKTKNFAVIICHLLNGLETKINSV